MTEYTLEQKRDWALRLAGEAEAELAQHRARLDQIREDAGGLLSFGGSGSQRAKHAISSATDRALKGSWDAGQKAKRYRLQAESLNRQIAERDRVRFTREDLAGSRFIRTSGGWHKVVKVNAKTVSVETGYSWTDRHPFEKVLEVRK